jgi:hypothetical protein
MYRPSFPEIPTMQILIASFLLLVCFATELSAGRMPEADVEAALVTTVLGAIAEP